MQRGFGSRDDQQRRCNLDGRGCTSGVAYRRLVSDRRQGCITAHSTGKYACRDRRLPAMSALNDDRLAAVPECELNPIWTPPTSAERNWPIRVRFRLRIARCPHRSAERRGSATGSLRVGRNTSEADECEFQLLLLPLPWRETGVRGGSPWGDDHRVSGGRPFYLRPICRDQLLVSGFADDHHLHDDRQQWP